MRSGFQGKTVMVTGASRGIGLAIAEAFAAEGARLHLLAEDDAVIAAARRLGAAGHVADISDGSALDAVFAGIPAVDALVNNAGIERLTPLAEPDDAVEATARRILEINVIGTRLVTRRAVVRMATGSAIVNTASIWGRVAEPFFDAYVASKHAIIGLTKSWAKELGPRGIRVNAVCPGWVRTASAMQSLRLMAARTDHAETALLAEIVAGQALPGLMEPADVVAPFVFLASDQARSITGQTLGIDRGEVPW